ncbi:MAG: hypothetical protein IT372_26065 [Polyangiaceae bacterium]|nr:hypothetical protein [Polyangiaceae bacterium]
MPRRPLLLLMALSAPAPALALAAGCGDTVVVGGNPGGSGAGAGTGGDGPTGGAGAGGKDGGKDALQEYEDPGCPDSGPAPTDFQCDPYHQNNGDCAPGEGCYIFVHYPEPGEVCGQEIYGALCAPAGFGGQGAPCNGAFDCQGGFVCVVTGAGNQCIQLCPLAGNDGCPPGLVCEPIDVEGFGGCL